MGTVWDWPNQQVVREDGSGPGVDTGGAAVEAEEASGDLSSMTKAELLDVAAERGVEVPDYWPKAEIIAAIEEADSEEASEPVV